MFTWVEVSKSALEYNLKQFRKLIGPKKLLMPVIKANAYGHGFLEVAKILQNNKETDRICVVNDDEALKLIEEKLTKKPIMILSFYELNSKKALILAKNNVIFPLFSLKQAKLLNQVGERLDKKIKIHLKIDTGATRVGILPKDVIQFAKEIKKYKFINIEGAWSHFASSEDDREYTVKQHIAFKKAVADLETIDIYPPIKHMSCSAATILYPTDYFNGFRDGNAFYGLHPSPLTENKIKLKPALSWYTKIIQIKTVPVGTKVGYGGTFTTKRPTKIAVMPVGYWDGYDRKLSNKGLVIINNKLCPIVGRICMNLSMIDITDAGKVKENDTVTLIGQHNKITVTADDFSNWIGTVNYEIVCRINPLLPRLITK